MPIRSISFYTYRSKSNTQWTDKELGVLRFVRALKNEALANAPGKPDAGRVPVNGELRLIRQKNADDAFDWFAEMAVPRIREQLGTLHVALVPIPNSDAVENVTATRTQRLAQAIRKQAAQATVADVLRWHQAMVPAHRGGPRDPDLLYPELRFRPSGWTPIARPHVLIDDVTTSAGHLRACAARLASRGASVALAICGAQAEQYFKGDPYELRIQEHDDYEP